MLLLVAAAVAWFFDDPFDAAAIGAVLAINVALGFITELRARRAIHALLRYDVPRARVVRSGTTREIDAREIVPGDIIEVEAGQAVPADARVLDTSELRVDESALTGESFPVDKRADVELDADTQPADRVNMLFKGTTAVAGGARAVVVATGTDTELGRVGGLVAGIREEQTPLERRLDALGVRLIWIALAVAALVSLVGVVRGGSWRAMIETGLALAIAAVPEGLPAIITIALAVGIQRMARRKALTRRLPAVEALGAATVICADKTGTLTAGEMTVTTIQTGTGEYAITGTGLVPDGDFLAGDVSIDPQDSRVLMLALRTGIMTNPAKLVRDGVDWKVAGDPTEGALLVAGRKAGLERERLLDDEPAREVLPFSSERQYSASFHEAEEGLVVYVKGAPETVLGLCSRMAVHDGDAPLDEEAQAFWREHNRDLAAHGLRVLALACGSVDSASRDAIRDLAFVGLAGMIDPPAPGVRETVDRFRAAGIRTVMITGDQRLTAEAIGRDLGVLHEDDEILEGRDITGLEREALAERIVRVGAFSRTSPENKLRLVEAYQRRGQIVAMLGDGVNDAAALRKADVGVAMGGRGTDVAREAADVVLQDDRFPTIGAAVEEGRVIYDNIRKFVFYLFSCNLAEVFVLLGAGIAGLPLPLLPLQILWLNIVTDTFPALSLALEPAEPDVMKRPPRNPNQAILSPAFLRSVAGYAGLIAAVTLAGYVWSILSDAPVERTRTVCFMTLALAQLFHLGNARSRAAVAGTARALSNRWALGAVGLVIALQLIAVHVRPLAAILDVTPPRAEEWIVIAILSVLPALVGQGLRHFRARASQRATD